FRCSVSSDRIEMKFMVGSALLGQKEWGSGDSVPAGWSENEEGQRLLVVNTADWFSAALSQGEVIRDVSHCVHLCAPGPHAFLLVTSLDEPRQGLKEVLENLELFLGDGCLEYTMMLFVHRGGPRDESIQRESQELCWVLDRCGNRHHILNLEQVDGTQLTELMKKLQDMVAANGGTFYSSKVYQKDSLRTMGAVVQEQEDKIQSLQERITELERQLKEERGIEKKEELHRELSREVAHRQEAERELQNLKDAMEREKRNMEQKHQQQMEDIRQMQERTDNGSWDTDHHEEHSALLVEQPGG
uniref:AIG1-type G domain-containing protein n=1 Tax=Scleropages formosus TaxID=113540 RepID=A0A8C9R2V3_SCLFO